MDAFSAVHDIRTHLVGLMERVLQHSSRSALQGMLRRVVDRAPLDLVLELYRETQDTLRPSLAFESEAAPAAKRWTSLPVLPTLGGWMQPPKFVFACASDFMSMREVFGAERVSRRWWRVLREGRPQLALRCHDGRSWRDTVDGLVARRGEAYTSSMRCLEFNGPRFGDLSRDVLRLANFRGLEEICLSSDREEWRLGGFGWLAHMPHLHSLRLEGCVVSDGDTKLIGAARGLRDLVIHASELSDAGVRHLRNLTELRTLELDCSTFPRASIDVVSGFAHLESLSLHGCVGVGDCLADLAGCEQLRMLWLSATELAEDALVHLGLFQHLDYVNLRHNRTLANFRRMPRLLKLTDIDLGATGVNRDALQDLSSVLPALVYLRFDRCAQLEGDLPPVLKRFNRLQEVIVGSESAISLRTACPSLRIVVV